MLDGTRKFTPKDMPGQRKLGPSKGAEPIAKHPARVKLDYMIQFHRQHPLDGSRIRDAFESLAQNSTQDERNNALRTSGLLEKVIKLADKSAQRIHNLDNLFMHVCFDLLEAHGEGEITTYMQDGDVHINPKEIWKLSERLFLQPDQIKNPDGLIVDREGFVVLAYASVLYPTTKNIQANLDGIRDHFKAFKSAGLFVGDDPEIVLFTTTGDTPIVNDDPTVNIVPFPMTPKDIIKFVGNEILKVKPPATILRPSRRRVK